MAQSLSPPPESLKMDTAAASAVAMPVAHAAATPKISPRDISFDVNASRIADWAGGSFVKTSFFNALSLMFPIGERFFISSVAAFRDVVTEPELLAEVKAFVAQEGMHTREHLAYNDAMRGRVDVDRVERREAGLVAFLRERTPPITHLAVTCALEHFTAIMAHEVLRRETYLKDAERSFDRLWTWHAIEECEHKSVAFDVLAVATAGRGQRLRRRTMVTVTINFMRDIISNCYDVFRGSDAHRSPVVWAKLAWFLFGYPGFLRSIVPAYVQYYRADFHPSQIDDNRERERGLASLGLTPAR
jgi:predicted metal-dependent hydrolase